MTELPEKEMDALWDSVVNGIGPEVKLPQSHLLQLNGEFQWSAIDKERTLVFGRHPETTDPIFVVHQGEEHVKFVPEIATISRKACSLTLKPDGGIILFNPTKRDLTYGFKEEDILYLGAGEYKYIPPGSDLRNFHVGLNNQYEIRAKKVGGKNNQLLSVSFKQKRI